MRCRLFCLFSDSCVALARTVGAVFAGRKSLSKSFVTMSTAWFWALIWVLFVVDSLLIVSALFRIPLWHPRISSRQLPLPSGVRLGSRTLLPLLKVPLCASSSSSFNDPVECACEFWFFHGQQ